MFIANHQITLDIPVLAALLRHDFTAVATKEARFDPRMLVAEAVLDPVPTTGWASAGLDRRIAGIRRAVQDTLDDWPSRTVSPPVAAPVRPMAS
ncbi:hypothetical protein [Actinoplanes xinjiangensis]|uniref:1-acyl-sn-glycerol-3-phosphate acyltransferase n=1 Tax=Actinoplanes xinjiangensis TaxID=512350 RepID=A0A316EE80_9ACTN|nr:hypothetical protein [Actinoplanes xinjiangensis]PWK26964.1 hypothetical protein BC793_1573 [Actinoplanes xinjiangensis]GIF45321.1 hypothetical protein Axi01nite_96320 [Actinoplanes xinjiangensis]